MSDYRPSFLDAYLVTDDPEKKKVVGVVLRKGHIWRIMLFGVPDDQQPLDEFERREAAGQHLLHLAKQMAKR